MASKAKPRMTAVASRARREEDRRKLHAVRHELRRSVEGVLKEHGIALRVHSVRFTDRNAPIAAASFNCCIINGVHVCGPQCP
jgi:hypothetical protein